MAKPKVLQDIGNTSQLTTNAKDLVGAVNELFQNANNGKSAVATAVGLPLQSSDTFSKMGTDIEKIKTDFANAINAKKALADGYVPPDLGNATADKVLIGSTFSSSVGENINGTMANRGNVGVQKLTTQNQIFNILNGFHDGNGQVKAEISNLIAGNIAKDVNVGGVVGTFEGGIKYAEGSVVYGTLNNISVSNLGWKPNMIVVQWESDHVDYYPATGNFIWVDENNRPTGYFYHINNSGYTMQIDYDKPIKQSYSDCYANGATWSVTSSGFSFTNTVYTSLQKKLLWYAFKTR